MNPKDKSMICRMAGNIVGPMYGTVIANLGAKTKVGDIKTVEVPEDFYEVMAEGAVNLAIAIVEKVEELSTKEAEIK